LDTNGNKVYKADGSLLKVKRQMAPGTFADGNAQELYHPLGQFKGMHQILIKHGIDTLNFFKWNVKTVQSRQFPMTAAYVFTNYRVQG
ncbi:hypothetical protein BT96DRAFT_816178, partial [Gymnopus androsaceus JB14]